jgi:hypothetical protein
LPRRGCRERDRHSGLAARRGGDGPHSVQTLEGRTPRSRGGRADERRPGRRRRGRRASGRRAQASGFPITNEEIRTNVTGGKVSVSFPVRGALDGETFERHVVWFTADAPNTRARPSLSVPRLSQRPTFSRASCRYGNSRRFPARRRAVNGRAGGASSTETAGPRSSPTVTRNGSSSMMARQSRSPSCRRQACSGYQSAVHRAADFPTRNQGPRRQPGRAHHRREVQDARRSAGGGHLEVAGRVLVEIVRDSRRPYPRRFDG